MASLITPFLPPWETFKTYRGDLFRRDLLAGLTVSVVEVPQAMAYAIIAGVSPVYGLYASIIQGIIGALFSSSHHLVTGPTNTQSLLIASVVTRLADPDASPAMYLQFVVALAVVKGVIQLTFAAARMGAIVRYVSRSVIVGLMSGAGVLIFVGQLPAFLGIADRPESGLPGVIGPIRLLFEHFAEINVTAMLVGCGTLAVLVTARSISRFIPGALLAVTGAAVVVWLMGWTGADLPLIAEVSPSLPHLTWPALDWKSTEVLLGGALALAILGMIESVAIAKSIATKTDQRISPNQEFFAQGLANVTGGFFQCMPGSGSFARSALAYDAGARTRFARLFNALFVAALFLLLGRQMHYIPHTSLAAVLLVIALGLVDWRYVPRMAKVSRSDAIVCGITFVAALITPLEYATFIGVFLNIGLYLRRASKLHMAEVVPSEAGPFIERPLREREGAGVVRFCQIEGDLFFGLADELQDKLTRLVHSDARVVILRLKRTHSLDATVLHVLDQFARDMQERGGHLVLCGVKDELMTVMRDFGLVRTIGAENVFETDLGVYTSAKRAIERAHQIIGTTGDDAPINFQI